MVLEHVTLIQNTNSLQFFFIFLFLEEPAIKVRLSNLRFFLGKKTAFWKLQILGPTPDGLNWNNYERGLGTQFLLVSSEMLLVALLRNCWADRLLLLLRTW